MEDNCTLPSLQDMLADLEELAESSLLEELAESLLADVTTDFESDAAKGGNGNAEDASKSKSMFGSVVGTKAKNVEPCNDVNGSLSTPTHQPKQPIKQEIIDCMLADDDLFFVAQTMPTLSAPIASTSQQEEYQPQISTTSNATKAITPATLNNGNNTAATTAIISDCNTDKSMVLQKQIALAETVCKDNDKTLYGTYDEENNCITVILPEDDISNFEEVIEEIVCNDEDDEYLSQVSALSPIPTNYPSPGYGSYCTNSNDVKSPSSSTSDHDSAYDSVLHSPPGKSWSTTSTANCLDDDFQYDYWPESMSVLFPSLA